MLNNITNIISLTNAYFVLFHSISELEEFIVESDGILGLQVKEDDYNALVRVMGILKRIRDRMLETDEMFKPLWETIELLKTYEVEFTEDTYIQLQVISTIRISESKLNVTHTQEKKICTLFYTVYGKNEFGRN